MSFIGTGLRTKSAPKKILSGELSFFASTVAGMENTLAAELIDSCIAASSVSIGKCGVHFGGNISTVLSAVMNCRTSLKIMENIAEASSIVTKDDLYSLVASLDWSFLIPYGATLKVDTVVGDVAAELSHTHFSSLTVKNAIVDQFMNRFGARPNVDTEDPDVPLLLYMHKGKATLYRVWSGEQSMHKRGYRQILHKAALRETTAAGLLLMSGWESQKESLCDPMCGSGTIAIEAALLAAGTAPGLLRYGRADSESTPPPRAIHWPGVDHLIWNDVWEAANKRDMRKEMQMERMKPKILANDVSRSAIELAIRAAGAAGVHRMIEFTCKDVSTFEPSFLPDVVITNPPWELRLEGAEEAWMKLGTFARKSLTGGKLWTLCGNADVTRSLGLRSARKIPINAASVDLRFIRYDIL